jgi:hypothetical protein
MRNMKLVAEGHTVYQSSFDERTGTLVREVELWEQRETVSVGDMQWVSHQEALPHEVREAIRERFPNRYGVIPSPSPELIDVGITNRCNMGCPYCYTDRKPRLRHAPKELVPKLLKSLHEIPYQIAIGGGEPTIHPDFIWILKQARELGTVPNFTTAGTNLTKKVIEAANNFCGGVALTYHAWKGFDWFAERYRLLKKRLTCQLNVHLIADTDVVGNLRALTDFQKEVGPINLVLLAYYPDVGRASLDRLMDRTTYSKKLPEVLGDAKAGGMWIAFSEGLLPYFVSRPELGIITTFAAPCEGVFSCYVDPKGFMSLSSFNTEPPRDDAVSVLDGGSAQKMWEELRYYGDSRGDGCYDDCEGRTRCSAPHNYLRFLCKNMRHNNLPLNRGSDPDRPLSKTRYKLMLEDEE